MSIVESFRGKNKSGVPPGTSLSRVFFDPISGFPAPPPGPPIPADSGVQNRPESGSWSRSRSRSRGRFWPVRRPSRTGQNRPNWAPPRPGKCVIARSETAVSAVPDPPGTPENGRFRPPQDPRFRPPERSIPVSLGGSRKPTSRGGSRKPTSQASAKASLTPAAAPTHTLYWGGSQQADPIGSTLSPIGRRLRGLTGCGWLLRSLGQRATAVAALAINVIAP